MKVCFVYIYGLLHYICKFKYFSFCQNVVTPFCFSLKGTNRLKNKIKNKKTKQKKKKSALELQFGKVLHRQRMHCYIKLIEVYKHTCCVLVVMPLMPVFCLSC